MGFGFWMSLLSSPSQPYQNICDGGVYYRCILRVDCQIGFLDTRSQTQEWLAGWLARLPGTESCWLHTPKSVVNACPALPALPGPVQLLSHGRLTICTWLPQIRHRSNLHVIHNDCRADSRSAEPPRGFKRFPEFLRRDVRHVIPQALYRLRIAGNLCLKASNFPDSWRAWNGVGRSDLLSHYTIINM